MRNHPIDLPEFRWVAVCVPLVLAACGGDGSGVTGTSAVGSGPQGSATATGTGAAAGAPAAAASITEAGAASPLPPIEPAPPPMSALHKVTTPAEIAAQRANEKDHPAPID